MFEALATFFQAWQTVVHISEWTGMSIGALAALVAIIWFVPPLRTVAGLYWKFWSIWTQWFFPRPSMRLA